MATLQKDKATELGGKVADESRTLYHLSRQPCEAINSGNVPRSSESTIFHFAYTDLALVTFGKPEEHSNVR